MSNNKKNTAGKLWTDFSVMQSLEEQLDMSGSIVESKHKLVRGSETFAVPDDATFSDNEKNEDKFIPQSSKSLFDDDNEEDVETFGVMSSRKRKRPLSPICRHPEKRHNERRNAKGLSFEKRFRRSRFDNNKKNKTNKNFSQKNLHAQNEHKKLRHLISKDYSNNVLYNVDFPPDADIDELGLLMAKVLGEKLPEIIQFAVRSIGKEQALSIFTECKRIEQNGGMLIANQNRRRTPGGVFLQLFKSNASISDEIKKNFFQFSKEVQKNAFKQRLEQRQSQEDLKAMEERNGTRSNSGCSNEMNYELSELPTAAEVFAKNLKNSILNNTNN